MKLERVYRNKIARLGLLLFLVAMLTVGVASAQEDAEILTVEYEGTFSYSKAYEMLDLLNVERAAEGLDPLEMDGELMELAMQRAAECAIYFDRDRPNGNFWWEMMGERTGSAGTSVSTGYETVREAIEAWMEIEERREIILNWDYESIGLGCFVYDGQIYWAQILWVGIADVPTKKGDRQGAVQVEILSDRVELSLDPWYLDLTPGETQFVTLYANKVKLNPSCYTVISSDPAVAKSGPAGSGTIIGVGGGSVSVSVAINGSNTGADLPVSITGFSDVSKDAWYYDNVMFAYENGIFSGVSSSSFAPEREMTRGMMVQVLYNMTDAPSAGEAVFADVDAGDWYYNAVNWAASEDVVSGIGGNRFAPTDNITRSSMAVILYNYCNAMEITLPVVREAIGFTDGDEIEIWAEEAVEAMYCAGVLSGKGNDRFDPKGTASRAEVATMLVNFVKAVS